MTLFHYVACGLKNVWLVDGFSEGLANDGTPVFHVEDVKGLHKAIGLSLVEKDALLTGDEFRFLRNEVKLTRKSLAGVLGISDETIKKWESGENAIHKTSDFALRTLFLESQDAEGKVRGLLDRINHLEKKDTEMHFKEGAKGWESEKQCA